MEQSKTIDGVVIKKVVCHRDERGFFAEMMKMGEPGFHLIEQTSYSISNPGVIKAFHFHNYWETWFVVQGRAQIVIHDTRENSSTKGTTQTLIAGEEEPVLVSMPPGVAHGYRVIGDEPVGMLYHAEEAYNPSHPEQIGTIPFNDPSIGFDWSQKP